MIFIAAALITLSALILIFMSLACFKRRQVSSVVFFASAGYTLIALANTEHLIEKFSEDIYIQMSLIYVIGSVSLSISFLYFSRLAPQCRLSLPIWSQTDFQHHAILSLKFALASVVIISLARGESLFMSWSEARDSNGFSVSLATALFMLSASGFVSAFYVKRYILSIVLFLILSFLFIVIGSRASLLSAIFFIAWIELIKARSIKSRLTVIVIGLTSILLAHTFLRSLRGFGIDGLIQAFNEGNFFIRVFQLDSDSTVDLTGGESEIPEAFMFAITQNSITDFGFMTSIQRILLLPIPSISGWFSKPTDITNILWAKAFSADLFSEAQGQASLLESFNNGNFGSMHPTIFGEYFVSGGWIALVLSTIILGFILVLIDRTMHRSPSLISLTLFAPVLVGYFFVSRGNSIVGFGYFIYLGGIVWLLYYMAKLLLKFKMKSHPTLKASIKNI